jgi:deazaflavin-dependent oxidoreductase (nitroreductase family)
MTSLADQLGFAYPATAAWRRPVLRLAATAPAAWLLARSLHHLDRAVFRITNHRATATSLFTGVPVLFLTTTGARSGAKRTSPILAIPAGDGLAVLGTGWGQSRTPAWVFNLQANPEAVLRYRDRAVPVTAAPAGDEEEAVWEAAARIYPGYAYYRRRVQRPIRVFVLIAS